MHDSLVLCSPDENATGKQLPLIFADGRVHPSLFLCFVKLSRHETQQAPGRRPPKRSRQTILRCCCSDRMTIPIQEKHDEASVVGNSLVHAVRLCCSIRERCQAAWVFKHLSSPPGHRARVHHPDLLPSSRVDKVTDPDAVIISNTDA